MKHCPKPAEGFWNANESGQVYCGCSRAVERRQPGEARAEGPASWTAKAQLASSSSCPSASTLPPPGQIVPCTEEPDTVEELVDSLSVPKAVFLTDREDCVARRRTP
jgi:hypothetical protein